MPKEKPVYTKEMHERREPPPIGSIFIMDNLPDNSRNSIFSGLKCEVLGICTARGKKVVTFLNEAKGVGALFYNSGSCLPLPTIEDELQKLIRGYYGGTSKANDLTSEILTKYNITSKEK